jgi:hypothetical protein
LTFAGEQGTVLDMLSQSQILEAVAAGRKAEALDSRDFARLADFFPASDWPALGMRLKEGVDPSTLATPRPWTEDEVKKQLAEDVAFGFEKALDKRGISASFMNDVVKMWMWVLEDDLQHMDEYAQYGLPLLKAVALKYGLPNEIGDDEGDEFQYSAEADY